MRPGRPVRKRSMLYLCLGLVAFMLAAWSFLYINAERNKTLDQRVQEVASQIKCPVCQGEPVSDAPADMARQMRAKIRQQLQEGKSKQEVFDYFREHYGDDILLTPQSQGFSLLAWLVPVLLLLGGCVLVFLTLRDWRRQAQTRGVALAQREAHSLEIVDAQELETYQALLEQELAEEDILFRSSQKEQTDETQAAQEKHQKKEEH